MAALALAGCAVALDASHDFQVTRHRFEKMRQGDPETIKRPWLTRFFFLNEAASGLKFMITGDSRHLQHYPSPRHLLAARMSAARESGDWKNHMRVAETLMFQNDFNGALLWADEAARLAPVQHRPAVADYRKRIVQAQQNASAHPAIPPAPLSSPSDPPATSTPDN